MTDINTMSAEELMALAKKRKEEEAQKASIQREAYEGIRAEFAHNVRYKIKELAQNVKDAYDYIVNESTSFKDVMKEYGQLKRDGQLSYSIVEGDFKFEYKVNKVKTFDERADVAAERLIEFLTDWIEKSEKGVNDPMYQLAMTLLERNRYGDLDYKSISKLYELEADFNNTEYSEIMQLFKESNVVMTTALNFYFSERDELGVWRKIEPNFNRL